MSSVFALALGEAGAHWLLDDDLRVETTGSQYKWYRFDARLGWVNVPSRHGMFRRKEFSHPVIINSHGMRYREVSRDPARGVLRVAVWRLRLRSEDGRSPD